MLKAFNELSLTTRILIGIATGIAIGLFFGEHAAILQPIADIYIRLMQMTVLPYMVMSLIIGLGQLDAPAAKLLAKRGVMLLVMVWAVTLAIVISMTAAFPSMETASFFSHALVEPRQPFSLPDLFFTANPFHSLANAVIPAIALFSTFVGVGLIGVKDKERALDFLRIMNAAIGRIARFNVSITPFGVCAIGAVTAGTMTPETFIKLEVYFVTFGAASLLMAFVVLPGLLTALTPFRYGETLAVGREALLTALVAGNAFIVLPMIVERTKELLEKKQLLDAKSDSAADVLAPIMFNFPNAGKMLTLLFIPFSAWLVGAPLTALDYTTLVTVGPPTYFAKAQIALPFLMDFFGLPHDLFQLYIPTTIVTGHFDSMVAAMNLLVFSLLGAAALGGFMKIQRGPLIRAGLMIASSTAVFVLAARLVFDLTIDTTYHRDEALRGMHASREGAVAVVHVQPEEVGPVERDAGVSRFEHILERGTLRIGYDTANIPFSFFNIDQELVGYDIELAQSLAEAFGLQAEFVPVTEVEMSQKLADGTIDVMPGVWYRPYWFSTVRLSAPYITGTMALAVRDADRHSVESIDALRASVDLRVGIPINQGLVQHSVARYFGDADASLVTLPSWEPFFRGEHPELDAFLLPAENASAWTLLHPEFTVVVPQPNPVTVPAAFAMALDAADLADAVNEWVLFASSDGMFDHIYDYWVLGEGAEVVHPRWSVIRNVLGWVE